MYVAGRAEDPEDIYVSYCTSHSKKARTIFAPVPDLGNSEDMVLTF